MTIANMLKETGVSIQWGDAYLERDEDGTYNVYSSIYDRIHRYNRICSTSNEEEAVQALLKGNDESE